METASVVQTPATWLPEDDILLKTSIEEGASLLALAKGAVPFSHTFTLQEVQDRWYALLYDPEISAKACVHLCLDESDKPKDISAIHRKRKVGTLRKRYHDRVKRVRNEFFSSPDLGFLSEPNLNNCTANGSAFHEQGPLHDGPQVSNTMLGDCIPDPFGLQVTELDLLHQDFPQILTDLPANGVSSAGDAFHSEGPHPLVNNHMTDTAEKDCLSGFRLADPSFPDRGSLGIDGMPHFQLNNDASLHGGSTDTEKCLLPGGEPSNSNVYTLGFSPPLPTMPLWKSMEDEVAPDMPLDVLPDGKMHNAQDLSELPSNVDGRGKNGDKQNGGSFTNSASISDGDFVDLPASLFDYSNDDMIFIDVDGNGPVDKSCCDNAFSGSHMDIDTLKFEEKAKVVANAAIGSDLEVAIGHLHTVLGEKVPVSHVKVQISSEPMLSNKPFEHSSGILYCAFNTEDPEIPCNDDIFLLIHPNAPKTSSAMTSNNTKCASDPVLISKRRAELEQSYKHSLLFGSLASAEIGLVHTVGGPKASVKDLAPKHKAVVDPSRCKRPQASLVSVVERKLDKNLKKVHFGTVETPAIPKGIPKHNEAGGVHVSLPEPEGNHSTSDKEGSESENEDPHFSDVEAMILDMDLQPYNDDLHFKRKVSKYQQENSKRTIMRLEQCARASNQRAMTSKGAIAVLHCRRTKHYIRKKEVILGRSTEETTVDIDLGKEGRHNKISRRQAIVKMEDDGSFSLKNLAKNPMLVNGSKVESGKIVSLSSNCLIEIRGTNFTFESNQKYVNRYLENIGRKNKGHMASYKSVIKQEVS